MSELHALETIEKGAFAFCYSLSIIKWAPNLKKIGRAAFGECQNLSRIMIPLSHHWFIRELPFGKTHKLLSVDMQGHDLKKAIRIKNLCPAQATRSLTNRLVSMYAKSPLTSTQLEDAAHDDESVTEEAWEETRGKDVQRLVEIQNAYADSIFKLLNWYAGNDLVENLLVNPLKRRRDSWNMK